MKKKMLVLLGITTVTAIILGACSNGKDTESGKQEISYALWDKAQAPVYKEIAKDFEKENPNIKINIEVTPWAQYFTKLETAITGKNAPDVFWLNIPKAPDYIKNNVLMDLSDVKLDEGSIDEKYLKAYTIDNKLYGIPKDFDSTALWYNKTMFDEAGVKYPDETWTWDTWRAAAKKLTNKEKGIYGMATPVTWQAGYYETIYQNEGNPFKDGGKKSGFADQATIGGVEFWHSFSEDGSAVPIDIMANTQQNELLLSGKIAMAIDGSWSVPVIFEEAYGKQNIDVAPLPKGKTRAATTNSLANVMSKDTKHKKAATKWIEYVASKKANEKVGKSGVAIPSYKGADTGWVSAYPDKNLKTFVDAVEYAVPLPNTSKSSEAIAIETDVLNKAWTGKETVPAACKELAKKADTILAK